MLKGKVIIDDHIVSANPEIVADMFANMGSDEQALFFNHVAKIVDTWDGGFPLQLQWITDDDGLTLAGRRVMQHIGEYSH